MNKAKLRPITKCYRVRDLYADVDRYHLTELWTVGILGPKYVWDFDQLIKDGFSDPLVIISTSISPWLLSVPHMGFGILTPNPGGKRNRDGTRGNVHFKGKAYQKVGISRRPGDVSCGPPHIRAKYREWKPKIDAPKIEALDRQTVKAQKLLDRQAVRDKKLQKRLDRQAVRDKKLLDRQAVRAQKRLDRQAVKAQKLLDRQAVRDNPPESDARLMAHIQSVRSAVRAQKLLDRQAVRTVRAQKLQKRLDRQAVRDKKLLDRQAVRDKKLQKLLDRWVQNNPPDTTNGEKYKITPGTTDNLRLFRGLSRVERLVGEL